MDSRNRTGRTARACYGAALMTSTMLAWTPALAQDEGTRVDEVIVTAQKRSESLQDVPFSIQALGSETLEELQVTSMNDFVQFLPSVSQRSAGPGATNVYMRGVASGDNANHSGPQPSVSVYLDEQPVTTIQGALEVHVYDIARVESLAGPQGTLYGASSQAGTIRIITNKPSMAGFEGGYDLELNSVDGGDSGWSMEGFANLPLSERMALRVVGWNLYDAGYIDNVPNTRLYTARGIFLGDPLQNTPVSNAPYAEENYNDVETYGARAALRIDLDDTWSITPSIMGQDQKANGNFAFDPNIGDLMNSRYRPEHSHDRWWQAAMAIEGRIANLDVMYSGSYLNRKIDAALDYSDYSYFYDAAYGVYWQDDLGVPLNDPSQYIQARDRFTKESHEFRVSSPQDRRVRFIAGLFHQRQQHQIRQRYKIDDLTPTYEVTGWSDTLWLTEQLRTDRDWAAFGDVTFDLTDRLSASAGVRFFKAENSLQGFFGFNSNYSTSTGENACFATPVQIEDAPCTNVDKVFEEDGFTHKLNLTYRFDDDRMVYATWSTGYRPGGVNRRGTLPPYESDFLTNYELGWKTSWLGNTLRFNGAVFYAEWEDFQIGVLGQNGLTDNRNAGGAEIKGLEADVFWRATPGFTVSGGVSLLDAQTTVNFCKADALGNTVFDCVGADLLAPPGTELPLTPDFKGNVTARNEFMIGGFDAHLQGSLVHQSSAWSDLRLIERDILGKMPSYTTLDFTGGFGRGNWTMELYLRNATDERANIQRYTQCQIQVCAGAVYIVPIQPRTVGIRFGQRF